MKALTVQQPWAWAIVHGGKDVENRTQAWGYRGPLAIHAGQRLAIAEAFATVERLAPGAHSGLAVLPAGSIIGMVDLVDVHRAADGCCESPWAEVSDAGDVVHLVLERPRALAVPVPCRGALGLWTVPAGVDDQVLHMLKASEVDR